MYTALSRACPNVDFAVIERALVTPQDRQEVGILLSKADIVVDP